MQRKDVSNEDQYFLEELETLSPEELRALQYEKTKTTLELAYNKSLFYRGSGSIASLWEQGLPPTKTGLPRRQPVLDPLLKLTLRP